MLSKLDDTEDNPIEVDRRTGTPRNTGTWGLIEQVHGIIQKPIRLPDLIYTNADNTGADARDKAITRLAEVHYEIGVFITAVPMTKLFAWGEGDSGGHVLRETTSRGLSAPITDPLFLIRNRSPDPLVQVAGRDHPFPIFAGSPGREGGIVSLNENCIYSLFSILSIRAGLSE